MRGDRGSPCLQQGKHDGDQGRSDEQAQEAEGDKAAEDARMVNDIDISMPNPISHGLMKLSTVLTNTRPR
jgi:hypothetical protein